MRERLGAGVLAVAVAGVALAAWPGARADDKKPAGHDPSAKLRPGDEAYLKLLAEQAKRAQEEAVRARQLADEQAKLWLRVTGEYAAIHTGRAGETPALVRRPERVTVAGRTFVGGPKVGRPGQIWIAAEAIVVIESFETLDELAGMYQVPKPAKK